jgi:hypothetical protein
MYAGRKALVFKNHHPRKISNTYTLNPGPATACEPHQINQTI